MCISDRCAAAKHTAALAGKTGKLRIVTWFAIQRLTGGLIMLVMMAFNMVLFLECIVFLAVAELAVLQLSSPRGSYSALGAEIPSAGTSRIVHVKANNLNLIIHFRSESIN